MSPITKDNSSVLTEEERVEQHRTRFFYEILGFDFDPEIITRLANSDVDPHFAKKLKDKGCPIDLIPSILL